MASQQHTAGSLATAIDAVLEGPADILVSGVSSITEARPGDITFMMNAKFAKEWSTSKATVGIIQEDMKIAGHDPTVRALLRVKRPDIAMAQVLALFDSHYEEMSTGIHESAAIDPTATIGDDVKIGPFVFVGPNAVLCKGVILRSHVRVGSNCEIGANTTLQAGVVIEHDCIVGESCQLHSNVSIGTDGFGFCPSSDMSKLIKITHIGNVVIGNNVEIGANSCVDRGKFVATTIGNGTKIDNLVQIGHNVKIGKNCVLAAGTGLGGSVQIGNWVQIGAQVGIAPHCKVGEGAKIGAKSGVMHDIPAGEEWLGVPAAKMKDVLRQWATTRKMPGIIAQFSKSKDQ